jgi:hypothetical protein
MAKVALCQFGYTAHGEGQIREVEVLQQRSNGAVLVQAGDILAVALPAIWDKCASDDVHYITTNARRVGRDGNHHDCARSLGF